MNRNIDFTEHSVRLDEPMADAVSDAFAALPRRGALTCTCRWERRLEVLSALEASGAFALRLEPFDGFDGVRISALKGKSGPCYDTGRRAVYRGAAAAVLDDDRHLIVGEIRVCEKTGSLYALEAYRAVLSVTAPDPALLARLESDPAPFDCNTFDADSRRLLELIDLRPPPSDLRVPVVYPGPFRALVLADGSVVRRGVAAHVAESQAAQNGLLRLPQARAGEARPCEHYAAASRARGAAFILEPLSQERAKPAAGFAEAGRLEARALAALRAAPDDVKRRLLQLIAGREPYWVLTGSDPEQAGGCCPSTTVGAANRLVAAGALQSFAPPAPPDACTAAFYAFSGEIGGGRSAGEVPAEPVFRILDDVRLQAAAVLRNDRWDAAKRAARVGLLMVLGVSLGLSAWRVLRQADTVRRSRLCAACEAAERFTHRVVGPSASGVAGAVSLGALAAVQPCALALLAGALALAWKPGAGAWANAGRCGAAATGLGVFLCTAAVAAAWGASWAFGGTAENVRAFRGPLMVAAGLLLTGLFRSPEVGDRKTSSASDPPSALRLPRGMPGAPRSVACRGFSLGVWAWVCSRVRWERGCSRAWCCPRRWRGGRRCATPCCSVRGMSERCGRFARCWRPAAAWRGCARSADSLALPRGGGW